MGHTRLRISGAPVWHLAAHQHGVVSRRQLLSIGLTRTEIQGRVARGRLQRLIRDVYAVGRPELTRHGWWMAAVLSCGPDAVLSHVSAAALWAISGRRAGRSSAAARAAVIPFDVSVPAGAVRSRAGVRLHCRSDMRSRDLTRRDGIPVTRPARTLIDVGTALGSEQLEAAVNEADKLGLIDHEALRSEVDDHPHLDGVAALRKVLDRRTFSLTDSELERRFLRLVRRAGLTPPSTRERVNGFQVDFFWSVLGLVVEIDGLRYHRTPTQHAKDRVRDQAHTAAGLTSLRFTHAQVRFEPRRVIETLAAVSGRLRDQVAATGDRPAQVAATGDRPARVAATGDRPARVAATGHRPA